TFSDRNFTVSRQRHCNRIKLKVSAATCCAIEKSHVAADFNSVVIDRGSATTAIVYHTHRAESDQFPLTFPSQVPSMAAAFGMGRIAMAYRQTEKATAELRCCFIAGDFISRLMFISQISVNYFYWSEPQRVSTAPGEKVPHFSSGRK